MARTLIVTVAEPHADVAHEVDVIFLDGPDGPQARTKLVFDNGPGRFSPSFDASQVVKIGWADDPVVPVSQLDAARARIAELEGRLADVSATAEAPRRGLRGLVSRSD